MSYHRKKKIPSRYRFLGELYPSGVALIIAFFILSFEKVICSMKALAPTTVECSVPMPDIVWWAIWIIFAYGLIASGYRFYRDFFKGDYYLDHPNF